MKDYENKDALSYQVGGNHYKNFNIQPVEFSQKNGLSFCEGNVIKYICRYHQAKNIQDLEKAKHYIELIMQCEKIPLENPIIENQEENSEEQEDSSDQEMVFRPNLTIC